jgi:hypothetical protein
MAFLKQRALHIFAKCLLLWLALALEPASFAAEPVSAAKVKAAFLYNFLKFVDWPDSAFTNSQSPYVVGILGRDPFGKVLEETFEDKPLNGRKVTIRRIDEDEASQCHLVFISPSEQRHLPQIFEALKAKPVLTVGDSEGFATSGGIINFIEEEKKIRFEINIDAAKRANLKLHSTMLNLAKIVRDH